MSEIGKGDLALQLGNVAFEDGDILAQLARYALGIAGVPSALPQALTDQPTFGNKLVAFLCRDASVARSGYCIQLDGHAFERTLGGREPFHQFLKVIARLPLVFSSLKAGAHFSNSAISPSKMDCCFLSSRAMPW